VGFDGDTIAPMNASESIPEVLLPVQVEQGTGFGIAEGERRLLCAMLLDAAACYCKYRCARDNNGRKLFREAERWIRSQEDRSPFSFRAVCGLLGLNAQQLRVSLLEIATRNPSAARPPGDENHGAGELRPRRLRHAAGSRSTRTGIYDVRSHRPRLVGRGDPSDRSLPRRG
jgi:hypothetical protein